MTKTGSLLLIFLSFLCTDCSSQSNPGDRLPAVAGQFYPAQRDELQTMLARLFSTAASSKANGDVTAIIVPHAGYVFSGGVAACGYSLVDPSKQYDNVFVLGPSHYLDIERASVYTAGDFITPLGTVKVNKELGIRLAHDNPVFTTDIEAHNREHSVEVQIPFLQYWLKKDFRIVPIVVAARRPETLKKIAGALRPFFNARNLFIISSDFSHYPSYEDAVRVDSISAEAVVSNSPSYLMRVTEEYEAKGIPNLLTTMCGWSCIVTLLDMTEKMGDVRYTRITYKNSGDSEAGDKSRVVGYNAIAVTLRTHDEGERFNDADKRTLLAIARNTILTYLKDGTLPEIDSSRLSASVKAEGGTFVTLRKKGELRGCVGRFDSSLPLYQTVEQMAVASATQDYRFPPVQLSEVGGLEIEISALTPMRRISSIDEFQLGRDGIYIKKGMRSGTFLPQVAAETGWSKEEFLGHCSQDKAGLGWDGWKDAELYVYQAIVFSEQDVPVN